MEEGGGAAQGEASLRCGEEGAVREEGTQNFSSVAASERNCQKISSPRLLPHIYRKHFQGRVVTSPAPGNPFHLSLEIDYGDR